jgi:hemin uptake protein HemP
MHHDRYQERFAVRREPLRPAIVRTAPQNEPDERPTHDARALTDGGKEAEIRLDGVRYVLRITRQGKLILTK